MTGNAPYLLLALAAGSAMAFQVVFNTQLRAHAGTPMQATLISLSIGALAALIYSLAAGYPWPTLAQLGNAPWWSWAGGFVGVFYLWSSVVVSPRLGVALTLGGVIAGQIAASVIIDHFGLLGTTVRPATLGRIAGVALMATGIALVAIFRE